MDPFTELARRHMLPLIQKDEKVRQHVQGLQAKEGVMGMLRRAAKNGGEPSPEDRQKIAQAQKEYGNVNDRQLISKAKEGEYSGKPVRMMERLAMKKEGSMGVEDQLKEAMKNDGILAKTIKQHCSSCDSETRREECRSCRCSTQCEECGVCSKCGPDKEANLKDSLDMILSAR